MGTAAGPGTAVVPEADRSADQAQMKAGLADRRAARRRIRELGFLPSGYGLRLLAPLCAVPPARGSLVLVLVTAASGRRSCSGTGFVVWWLLIAHGFLPLRGYGAAPPIRGHTAGLRPCTGGVKLTHHCYQFVLAWRRAISLDVPLPRRAPCMHQAARRMT